MKAAFCAVQLTLAMLISEYLFSDRRCRTTVKSRVDTFFFLSHKGTECAF